MTAIYFGKHKGKDIEDIPSNYLKWLAENCDIEAIAEEADEEYQYRDKFDCHFWE